MSVTVCPFFGFLVTVQSSVLSFFPADPKKVQPERKTGVEKTCRNPEVRIFAPKNTLAGPPIPLPVDSGVRK
jgi:hypothetical protein